MGRLRVLPGRAALPHPRLARFCGGEEAWQPSGGPEGLAACGKTRAAFDRRSIPAEPLRFAPFCVAFRSKYTRYSSLTRLVSRTPTGRTGPRRSRRSRGFHHRLLGRQHNHGADSGSPRVRHRHAALDHSATRCPSLRVRTSLLKHPAVGPRLRRPVNCTFAADRRRGAGLSEEEKMFNRNAVVIAGAAGAAALLVAAGRTSPGTLGIRGDARAGALGLT